LDGGVSDTPRHDTPIFDATLSDVLARVRREADARVAVAAAEVDRLQRESQVRAAIVRDQVEEAVRAELAAAAPPLIELRPIFVEEDEGPTAPPIPAFAELRTSGARIDAFFDSLIGP
jgi:hypothetical protein